MVIHVGIRLAGNRQESVGNPGWLEYFWPVILFEMSLSEVDFWNYLVSNVMKCSGWEWSGIVKNILTNIDRSVYLPRPGLSDELIWRF